MIHDSNYLNPPSDLAKDEGHGMSAWNDGDKEIVSIAADNAINFIDDIQVETTTIKDIRNQERKLNTVVSQLRMKYAKTNIKKEGKDTVRTEL